MSYKNAKNNQNLPLNINRSFSSSNNLNGNNYDYNQNSNGYPMRVIRNPANQITSELITNDYDVEIETRDADSIHSESTHYNNSKTQAVNNKTKPKLYTFYDYIKKNNKSNNSNIEKKQENLKKEIPIFQNQTKNLNNKNFKQQQQQYYEEENSTQPVGYSLTGQFKQAQTTTSPLQTNRNLNSDQDTMPISSGFGGYTSTTRRKTVKKPEPKLVVSPRKPVKLQPLYRVNSEEDFQRTILVEEEPEEVVQIVHRPRPKPKEKIIYVDEPVKPREKIIYYDEPPQQNVVYVDQPQSQVVYAKPQTNQVVYAQAAQPQQQYVYQQQPQVVYANQTARPVYEQPQVQYIVQPETQIMPQSQYITTQPQYIAQPQYMQPFSYIDQPMASNYVYVTDPNAIQNASTIPTNNIVYR